MAWSRIHSEIRIGFAFAVITSLLLLPARAALVFTNLVDFNGANGTAPMAGLATGSDGNLYGVTSTGGTADAGTIFRLTTAGQFTSVWSFDVNDGSHPVWITAGPNGALFGVTQTGGNRLGSGGFRPFGTVFKITTAGVFTSLDTFTGYNGYNPVAVSVLGGGILVGAAGSGGSLLSDAYPLGPDGYVPSPPNRDFGTVFTLVPDGASSIAAIHLFDGPSLYPSGPLLQASDGSFYGEAQSTNEPGCIYRMDLAGGFQVVTGFPTDGSVGGYPEGGLVEDGQGNLYGVASGINTPHGSVFKFSRASGILSPLVVFTGPNGGSPHGMPLVGPDGFLYGTTEAGGNFGQGVLYRVSTNGDFAVLFHFRGGAIPTFSSAPYGGLIRGPDGNIYGTTVEGGAFGHGTVFRVSNLGPVITNVSPDTIVVMGSNAILSAAADGPSSTAYHWLFNGSPLTNGNHLSGANSATLIVSNASTADAGRYIVQVDNGWGTASTNVNLSVFVSPPVHNIAFDTLYHFDSTSGGGAGGLLLASNHIFYGPTLQGGGGDAGAVFAFTPPGAFSNLYAFSYSDGAAPIGNVIQGADGNLYGTCSQGGALGGGTVFSLSTSGQLNTLANFSFSVAASPNSRLIPDNQGNLYGTTSDGGSHFVGTVFQLTPGNNLSAFYSFNSSQSGANPAGDLIRDANGNFLGTTPNGGTGGFGTVFKLSTNGTVTILASFNGTNGSNPQAGLTLGNDGNFYGTTAYGGDFGVGTVFRLTPAGALHTLFSFNYYANGAVPLAGLLLGSNGNFFGATSQSGEGFEVNGPLNSGTVFEITPSGTLTTLINFSNADGNSPDCTLVDGQDGYYYGRTAYGGNGNQGTIFRFATGAPYLITTATAQTVAPGATASFQVVAGSLTPVTYQWQFNSVNLTDGGDVSGATSAHLSIANVSAAEVGNYSVIVSNAAGGVTTIPVQLVLGPPPTPIPSTIDSVNKYAYAANFGWIDWLDNTTNGAVIGEYVCSGYIYSANFGWVNLGGGSPTNGVQYQNRSANDFGVNQDGLGNLRGYAYGANIGWINFEDSGAPKVDLTSGNLSGYAWSANWGWISLHSTSAQVQTHTILAGADSDHNGLPDAWEIQHFGHLGVDPVADPDHDGMSNFQEYLAGTDPNDPGDKLVITGIAHSAPGDPALTRLQWTGKPTRSYAIQSRPAVDGSSSWIDLQASPLPGAGDFIFSDASTNQFYRLRVFRPLAQ